LQSCYKIYKMQAIYMYYKFKTLKNKTLTFDSGYAQNNWTQLFLVIFFLISRGGCSPFWLISILPSPVPESFWPPRFTLNWAGQKVSGNGLPSPLSIFIGHIFGLCTPPTSPPFQYFWNCPWLHWSLVFSCFVHGCSEPEWLECELFHNISLSLLVHLSKLWQHIKNLSCYHTKAIYWYAFFCHCVVIHQRTCW